MSLTLPPAATALLRQLLELGRAYQAATPGADLAAVRAHLAETPDALALREQLHALGVGDPLIDHYLFA